MATRPNVKSKKEDILQAFDELQEEKKQLELELNSKQREAQRVQEKKVVEEAQVETHDHIIKSINNLQVTFNTTVRDLSHRLSEEREKLETLKEAISIEENHLKELHNIEIAANTLDILISDYEEKSKSFSEDTTEKRKTFEQEMTLKRAQWEREKAEYEYTTTRTRKIDEDEYLEKKKKLEKELHEIKLTKERELAEREKNILEKEKLFAEYEAKIKNFPKELENTIKETREKITQELNQKAQYKYDLYAKEVEGSGKVYAERIKALELTIANQDKHIEKLTSQLGVAQEQVQALAGKAIESASKAESYKAIKEMTYEQGKERSERKTN